MICAKNTPDLFYILIIAGFFGIIVRMNTDTTSQDSLPFPKASDEHYLRYIRAYLKTGKKLSSDMLVCENRQPDVYLISAEDQRRIPYVDHKSTTYYLFDLGEDVIFDRHANGSLRNHARILSCKKPLTYNAPPFITSKMVEQILKEDETQSLETIFFDQDLFDYFLVLKCLGSAQQNNDAGTEFADHLLDTHKIDDLRDILNYSLKDSVGNHYERMKKIESDFFNAVHNPRSSLFEFISRSTREMRNASNKIESALVDFADVKREILRWQPLSIAPPKGAQDKSTQEAIMRQRLAREANIMRKFK